MPIYEYECKSCGEVSEFHMYPGDTEPKRCPECGNMGLSRIISASTFHLKGSGWYATDYKERGDNDDI